MDEPLDDDRVDSLNFMVACYGVLSIGAGLAIRLSLDEVERESYESVNLLNVSDYAPHFFIAAGIPLILSYQSSKAGYAAAALVGLLNVVHELGQHYGAIGGGFQLEDILAGTAGAVAAAAITKYAYGKSD
ncbi:MAG: hypothetical protein AABX51_09135 [Nanoarchaeota archaeon]